MNIGFYTSRLDGPDTGPGVYRKNLARALLRNKSKQDVIKFIHYKKYDCDIYKKNNEIIIPQPPVLPKITRYLTKRDHFGRDLNFLTESYLSKYYNFDILHLQAIPYRPFWFYRDGAKLVTTIHFTHWYTDRELWGKYKRKRLQFIWSRLAQKFDAIFTVSKASKKILVEGLGIEKYKIYVTYNGVSNIYRPTYNDDILKKYDINTPYIFHLSNASERKNPQGIVKGFKKAVKKYNIKNDLVLAGSRWEDKNFKSYLKDKSVLNKIKFLGYVSEGDLPTLYSYADFFFLPSFSEGFGIPILESMACGTPVLTTFAYAIPEVAGDAAVYIKNPKNYEEIADKIKEILDNKKGLNKLCLKRSKKFSWDKTAQETLKVYKKVVNY